MATPGWLLAPVGICILQVDNMVGTRASTRLRAATKEELNTPIPNMPDEDHEDREEEEEEGEEGGEKTEEVDIDPKLRCQCHHNQINRLGVAEVSQLLVGNVMSSKLQMPKVKSENSKTERFQIF